MCSRLGERAVRAWGVVRCRFRQLPRPVLGLRVCHASAYPAYPAYPAADAATADTATTVEVLLDLV